MIMKIRLQLYSAAVLFVTCSYSIAAILDMAETWPDHSVQGWASFDHAGLVPSASSFSVSEGTLTLVPDVNVDFEDNPKWSFLAGPSSSSGILAGSYTDAGAQILAFDIESSVPATMVAELVRESEFLFYEASMSVTSGITHIEIPLDDTHFLPGFLSASNQFHTVLDSVEKLFITFEWDKMAPNPKFSIGNVKLVGSEASYGSWIEGFNLDSTLIGYNVDADGDGLLNAYEYVIDSSPNVSNGPFVITMEPDTLRWAGSSNCTYFIMRSTNLVDGVFEPASILPGISGDMQYVDPAYTSNAFYTIRVERR